MQNSGVFTGPFNDFKKGWDTFSKVNKVTYKKGQMFELGEPVPPPAPSGYRPDQANFVKYAKFVFLNF